MFTTRCSKSSQSLHRSLDITNHHPPHSLPLLPSPRDSTPQVRRRNWLRRLPFLHVGAGCGFQPLAARLALELAANPPLPPDAAIPAEPNETPEQQRALLRQGVFGNEGIFKLITSYI